MASLTAKYRPQRFSDVAGQESIRRILSRASAEDKIAPAYLFSGTRGVGKTTLARVLAKALNCLAAPTPEPCNECSQCRQITAGVSPDVIEIDAATHGKVEETRELIDAIGYAPMQSRYKVIIIDEAHMLTKHAFNALLKTLEEPPGRVTFILATTEPHKILPTIISRCQHYVFKRLAQPELESHLSGLLDRESMGFEPSAVSLIARRGAGSVRDSMSLLAQVLAMGGETLLEQDVRDVLGMAGQDVFLSLMRSFKDLDCLGVSVLLRQVLDRGLDIGFFLRELASCWRDMFLLNQSGEKALANLELSEEEGRQWMAWAGQFDARHIHACWQMTLEGQRRVMTSLEPALALELLLLNLAYIPKLLSLDALNSAGGAAPGRPGGGPRPNAPGAPRAPGSVPPAAPRPGPVPSAAGGGYPQPRPPQGAAPGPAAPYGAAPLSAPRPMPAPVEDTPEAPPASDQPPPWGAKGTTGGAPRHSSGAPLAASPVSSAAPSVPEVPGIPGSANVRETGYAGAPQSGPYPESYPGPESEPDYGPLPDGADSAPDSWGDQVQYQAQDTAQGRASDQAQDRALHQAPDEADEPAQTDVCAQDAPSEQAAASGAPKGPPTWAGFVKYAQKELHGNNLLKTTLKSVSGTFEGDEAGGVLMLSCPNFQAAQIRDKSGNLPALRNLAAVYFGRPVRVEISVAAARKQLSQQELRAKAEQAPLFQEARETMGAYIIDVRAKH